MKNLAIKVALLTLEGLAYGIGVGFAGLAVYKVYMKMTEEEA